MTLDIPDLVTLPDGTTAQVKAVTAHVTDGRVDRVIYTIEKSSGAWMDVAGDAVHSEVALR